MKNVILAGAGHAHVHVIRRIDEFKDRGLKVSVISPDDNHVYSGMSPGYIGGIYTYEDVALPVRKLTEQMGGTFIRQSVTRVNVESREVMLDDGNSLQYDLLSFNTGSISPLAINDFDGIYPVKPLNKYISIRQELKRLSEEKGTVSIVIAGGGATGVEMALNLQWACEKFGSTPHISHVTGRNFLSSFPRRFKKKVQRVYRTRGIEVFEGQRVQQWQDYSVQLEDGTLLDADLVVSATGVKANPDFNTVFCGSDSLPVNSEGALLVTDYLNSPDDDHVFGAGDCVAVEQKDYGKIGVHAVFQGKLLTDNMFAVLQDKKPVPYKGKDNALQILNMSRRKGLMVWGSLVLYGTLVWYLKDYIDRSFMRRMKKLP